DMRKNNLSKADDVTVKKSCSHYCKGERTRGADGRSGRGGQFEGASFPDRKNSNPANGGARGSGKFSTKNDAKNDAKNSAKNCSKNIAKNSIKNSAKNSVRNSAKNSAKNSVRNSAKNTGKKIGKHISKYIAEDEEEDGDEGEGEILGETQGERKRRGKKKSGKKKSGKNSSGKNSSGKNSSGKNSSGKNSSGKSSSGKDTAERDDRSGNCSSREAGTKNYAQGRRGTLHDDSRAPAPEWHFVRNGRGDEASGHSAGEKQRSSHRSGDSGSNSGCKRGSRRRSSSISVSLRERLSRRDGGPLFGGNVFLASETEGGGSPPSVSPKHNARVVAKSGRAATPSGSHIGSKVSSTSRSDCADRDTPFKKNSKHSHPWGERTMNSNSYSLHDAEDFEDAHQQRYAEEESPPYKESEQRGKKNKKKNSKGINVDLAKKKKKNSSEIHDEGSIHDEKKTSVKDNVYENFIREYQNLQSMFSFNKDKAEGVEGKKDEEEEKEEEHVEQQEEKKKKKKKKKDDPFEGPLSRALDRDVNESLPEDVVSKNHLSTMLATDGYTNSMGEAPPRDAKRGKSSELNRSDKRVESLEQLSYNFGYYNHTESIDKVEIGVVPGKDSLRSRGKGLGGYDDTGSSGVVPIGDNQQGKTHSSGKEDTSWMNEGVTHAHVVEKNRRGQKSGDVDASEEGGGKKNKTEGSSKHARRESSSGSVQRMRQIGILQSGAKGNSHDGETDMNGVRGENSDLLERGDMLEGGDLVERGDLLKHDDLLGKASLSSNKRVPNENNYFEYEANNSKKLLHKNMSSMYSMNESNLTFHQDFFKDILLLNEEKKKKKSSKQHSFDHFDELSYFADVKNEKHSKHRNNSTLQEDEFSKSFSFKREKWGDRKSSSAGKNATGGRMSLRGEEEDEEGEEKEEEKGDDEVERGKATGEDVYREESDDYGDYDGEGAEGGGGYADEDGVGGYADEDGVGGYGDQDGDGDSYGQEDLRDGDYVESPQGASGSHKERKKKKKPHGGEVARKNKNGKVDRVKIVEEKNKPHKRRSVKEKRNSSRTHNNSICSLGEDHFYDDAGDFPYHDGRGRPHDGRGSPHHGRDRPHHGRDRLHDGVIGDDPPDDKLYIDVLDDFRRDDLHKGILAYSDEVQNPEEGANSEKAKKKRKANRRKKEDFREEYMKEFFTSVLDNQIYKKNLNSKDFCHKFAPEGEGQEDAEEKGENERGGEGGDNRGSDRGDNRGSDRGDNRGSDRGDNRGSDRGDNRGSDRGDYRGDGRGDDLGDDRGDMREKHMLKNVSKVIRTENINDEIELLRNEILQTKIAKENLPSAEKKKGAHKIGNSVEMTHRKKKSYDKEEEKRTSFKGNSKGDLRTGKDGSHHNTFASTYAKEDDYYNTFHHERKKRESHVKLRDVNFEEDEKFKKSKGRSRFAGRDTVHSINDEGRSGIPPPTHGNNGNSSGGGGGLHLNKSLEFFSNNFLSLKRLIERKSADTNYDAKREDDYVDKADEEVDMDVKKKKKTPTMIMRTYR
ncbi:ubiquitin carboxyl-terminal hydrolase, partial [Plasmodium cynomolgi strain B]